ncbi:MAG: TolC family protein [Bacteroidales bacterium]|nr:TolC family protein [Bacteroidales bacterium]
MKKYIAFISISLFCTTIFSQTSIENVLLEIEKNNTSLQALRKSVDAEKLGNKTGIYLQNPEIGFAYLWGSPVELGTRANLSISQSFDFPTVYKHKKQIANSKNEQIELEYQKQLKNIQLQTRLLCFDIVYINALENELSKRLIHAQSIANSYKAKFTIGETNILEYNKAQLNLLNTTTEIESIDIERTAALAELSRLNGGILINFTDSQIINTELNDNFEDWYAEAKQSNPLLKWLKQEIEISQQQIKLSKAMKLPKFQAGYMSEGLVDDKFQGITLGLSIPLRENKNTVKYANAQAEALKSIEFDEKMQFYNKLKAFHAKAIAVQNTANNYRQNLKSFDNSALLKKALESGQISLIDYMQELSIYYESINKLLELERELNKTIAELCQFE